jgi:hypothetical protein
MIAAISFRNRHQKTRASSAASREGGAAVGMIEGLVLPVETERLYAM